MAELKSCPFCGSPAEVEAYTPSRSVHPEGPRVGYIASCTNDDCDAELSITTYNKIATIAAWNRRAVDASTLQVRSSEAASQSSPSSARERREIIEECAQEADIVLKSNFMTRGAQLVDIVVPRIRALAALSSDGRGREKGNTSNSDDGIDPSPPATNRSA